jgi:hypothetical protein
MAGAAAPAAAPVIVAAEFGKADFAWLDRLRRTHFPIERNQLPAHLTLFHHLPPSALPELDARLKAETRITHRPHAMIGEPILLGRGVALRVRCEPLESLRARLAEAFAGLLTPQDAAGWRPHVTIQNKVEPQIAKVLLDQLKRDFHPRPLDIAGYASWWYRGGPWETHSRHMVA